MNISIIVPNYNGQELLKKNLPKVFNAINFHTGKKEVIVTDDASLDGSVSLLENIGVKVISSYPDIKFKIIKNEKNLGFSSNVNRGVNAAEGDIVILLNTDVIPERGFLVPLLSHFMNDDKVFAVGCMDKSIERGKTVLRGRGIGFWKRGFLVHKRGQVDKTNTLWVSGGSGAFRRKIWDKLGGFSNLYNPFYWEDIDLSYRALKSGYKIVFEPKSVVVHEHEEGAIKKGFTSFKVKTVAYRNQLIFVWKNATDLNLQFLHLFWLPYYFTKAFLSRDWAFLIGLLKAFILLPKIIRSSFEDQKFFVKKDSEVISIFK